PRLDPNTRAALANARFADWLPRLPLKPGLSPLALSPDDERWLFDIWTRGDYDEFWRQPGLSFEEHLEHHADVPMLYTGAWYDAYTRSTLACFAAFSAAKRGPGRAIIGPWTHGTDTVDRNWSGVVEFGPAAAISGKLA